MCDIFQVLINSLVCLFCTGTLGLVLFQIVSVMQFVCFLRKAYLLWTEYISIDSTISFGLEHVQPGAFVEVSDPSKKCALQSDMHSDTCLDDEALEKSLCLLIYAAVCCLVSL